MISRKRWEEDGQILPHYIGPLSSFPEWHSLGIGFYHGFSEDKKIPRKVVMSNSDVSKEPHMAKIGFPIGVASKYGLLLGAGMYAAQSPLCQNVLMWLI